MTWWRTFLTLIIASMIISCNNPIIRIEEQDLIEIQQCWRKSATGCTFKFAPDEFEQYSQNSCPGYKKVKWLERTYYKRWFNETELIKQGETECE